MDEATLALKLAYSSVADRLGGNNGEVLFIVIKDGFAKTFTR